MALDVRLCILSTKVEALRVKSLEKIIGKKDMQMNDFRMKNNVLENKTFKRFVFIITIVGTTIMNLGYIQSSRDSSKVDFSKTSIENS